MYEDQQELEKLRMENEELKKELHRVKSESPHEDYGCEDAQPLNANSALFHGYGH